MKDAKPIFIYAKSKGEAKIVDRILVRILPELIKYDQKMTSESIEQSEHLFVPDALYDMILEVSESFTGLRCCDGQA